MRYKTDSVTLRFDLDENERHSVVYSTYTWDYNRMWAVLEKLGAEKPAGAKEIELVIWDPEDGGCLVTWKV